MCFSHHSRFLQAVCERLGQTLHEEQIGVATMETKPEAIVSELFFSVCAEIRDEVITSHFFSIYMLPLG